MSREASKPGKTENMAGVNPGCENEGECRPRRSETGVGSVDGLEVGQAHEAFQRALEIKTVRVDFPLCCLFLTIKMKFKNFI